MIEPLVELTIQQDKFATFQWWVDFYPDCIQNTFQVLCTRGTVAMLKYTLNAKLHLVHDSQSTDQLQWKPSASVRFHQDNPHIDIYRLCIREGTASRPRLNLLLQMGFKVHKNHQYFSWIVLHASILSQKIDTDVLDWFFEQRVSYNATDFDNVDDSDVQTWIQTKRASFTI
jgi:hypothetical protein